MNNLFHKARAFQTQPCGDGVEIVGYEGVLGETLVIPDELDGTPVRGIRSRAFYGLRQLKNAVLPEGLRTIGDGVFLGCDLDVVRLPVSLEEIGGGWSCSGFEIPGSHARFRVIDGVLFDKEAKVLSACPLKKDDESYSVPQGVERIGNAAFQGCTSLKNVELPEGLKTIGSHAFSWCKRLRSVRFPNGLQTIEDRAFWDCPSLRSADFPEGLQTLGTGAFRACKKLRSVRFPNSLRTIGDGAFELCSSLESADLPEGLETVGNNAFACCGLRKASLPGSLIKIGNGSFSKNIELSAPEGSCAAKWIEKQRF